MQIDTRYRVYATYSIIYANYFKTLQVLRSWYEKCIVFAYKPQIIFVTVFKLNIFIFEALLHSK